MLINELTQEAQTSREVLERVPENQLSWKPHAKSMSIGQLALHIARIPGSIAELLSEPSSEIPDVPLDEPTSLTEILTEFEQSIATALNKLSTWDVQGLQSDWTMTQGKETVMVLPRLEMVRSVMLNHWYHHRGQLIVYLRLLNLSVPAVYGPSADED